MTLELSLLRTADVHIGGNVKVYKSVMVFAEMFKYIQHQADDSLWIYRRIVINDYFVCNLQATKICNYFLSLASFVSGYVAVSCRVSFV